jgi:hypothetical protein
MIIELNQTYLKFPSPKPRPDGERVGGGAKRENEIVKVIVEESKTHMDGCEVNDQEGRTFYGPVRSD